MTRSFAGSAPFPQAAAGAPADTQLRRNLAHATHTIRARRQAVVSELPDWEGLRRAGETIRDVALDDIDTMLEQLKERVASAGGVVHEAADAADANRIVVGIVRDLGARSVVKVKSMTTAEIELNRALEAAGIAPYETDLAELIVQLGEDLPSHILVPAIHRNRAEIRSIFLREMGRSGRPAPADLSDDPHALAGAARLHLRERFLAADVAISGANFMVAETGTLVLVESEGNGRMCVTLPRALVSVVGIDKVVASWKDLEVLLQLLPRSSTGERMNPYTSMWTGVVPADGPEIFHLVLLDNGRRDALADPVGRQALRCIRCSACLNVCPVYERVGGHAYGSPYPGPIGAVLVPQLRNVASDEVAASLPYASTLCGACFEVCPVRIDIPRLLVHLRVKAVEAKREKGSDLAERAAMASAGWVLSDRKRFSAAARAASLAGWALRPRRTWRGDGNRPPLRRLPGPLAGWTDARDAPLPASEPFSAWWKRTRGLTAGPPPEPGNVGGPRHEPASERPPHATTAGDRTYRGAGDVHMEDPVRVLVERLRDYGARVVICPTERVGDEVATALARNGSSTAVTPADLPAEWLAATEAGDAAVVVVVRDRPPVTTSELDSTDSAVTGCALAIADTGTIVLDGGVRQGRRALSLVPDHLVIVVADYQVVPSVPDAISLLSPGAPQTWISGPSATSDIELRRVEGVHGPRSVDVVISRPG